VLVKEVPESNPVARKEVREEQRYHAVLKLSPAVRGIAGMVARAVHCCHALWKLVPEFRPVARKEVREEQPCHV
tara:strand:- start:201 stop:422 length:222 start_codon:yes stop_codon:yes gene_type:complete